MEDGQLFGLFMCRPGAKGPYQDTYLKREHDADKLPYERLSKLLVSPSIAPIIVPYISPYIIYNPPLRSLDYRSYRLSGFGFRLQHSQALNPQL